MSFFTRSDRKHVYLKKLQAFVDVTLRRDKIGTYKYKHFRSGELVIAFSEGGREFKDCKDD